MSEFPSPEPDDSEVWTKAELTPEEVEEVQMRLPWGLDQTLGKMAKDANLGTREVGSSATIFASPVGRIYGPNWWDVLPNSATAIMKEVQFGYGSIGEPGSGAAFEARYNEQPQEYTPQIQFGVGPIASLPEGTKVGFVRVEHTPEGITQTAGCLDPAKRTVYMVPVPQQQQYP